MPLLDALRALTWRLCMLSLNLGTGLSHIRHVINLRVRPSCPRSWVQMRCTPHFRRRNVRWPSCRRHCVASSTTQIAESLCLSIALNLLGLLFVPTAAYALRGREAPPAVQPHFSSSPVGISPAPPDKGSSGGTTCTTSRLDALPLELLNHVFAKVNNFDDIFAVGDALPWIWPPRCTMPTRCMQSWHTAAGPASRSLASAAR